MDWRIPTSETVEQSSAVPSLADKYSISQLIRKSDDDAKKDIWKWKNDEEFLSELEENLFSQSHLNWKGSLHVLRLITDIETENTFNTPMPLFFDTFEILDEKQYHVIEPFIAKLEERLGDFMKELLFVRAYLILLRKMIQHDNRLIAEKGFYAFIRARRKLENLTAVLLPLQYKQSQKFFSQMLERTLMPVLVQNVGWMFPEADQFFIAAEQFGKFLHKDADKPETIYRFLITFLNDRSEGLSPLSVLFLLEALKTSLLHSRIDVYSLTSEDFDLLNMCMRNVAGIGDSYIRKLIEIQFICIFSEVYQAREKVTLTTVRKFLLNLRKRTICSNWKLFPSFMDFLDTEVRTNSIEENRADGRIAFLTFCVQLQCLETGSKSKEDTYEAMLNYYRQLRAHSPISTEEFFKCLNLCNYGIQPKLRNMIFNSELRTIVQDIRQESASVLPQIPDIMDVIATSSFDCDKSSLEDVAQIIVNGIASLEVGLSVEADMKAFSALLSLTNLLVRFGHTISSSSRIIKFFKSVLKETEELPKCATQDRNLTLKFLEVRINFLANLVRLLAMLAGNSDLNAVKDDPLRVVMNTMDISGPLGIFGSIEFVTSALSIFGAHPDLEKMGNFVQLCWSYILEMRKSSHFWKTLKSFVKLLTNEYFQATGILTQYAVEMMEMGENTIGFPLILVERFAMMSFDGMEDVRIREISELCVKASYHGVHLMKHNRMLFRVYDYQCRLARNQNTYVGDCLRGLESWEKPEFTLTADTNTRVLGLFTLITILSNNSDECLVFRIVENYFESIQVHRQGKRGRSANYVNSPTHRFQQRVSQALLLLQPYYYEALAEEVNDKLLNLLLLENCQRSVRYLIEWTIVMNLGKFPQLHNKFFETSVKNIELRAGFGCSFSTISYHVVQALASITENASMDKFCADSLNILVNLLIGQHLLVRVSALVCFRRIYEKWPQSNLRDRYEVIYQNVVKGSLTNSGLVYKTVDVVEDFWIDYFHPLMDFNVEAILIDVPLLAGMSFDENIQRKELLSVLDTCTNAQANLKIRSHLEDRRTEYQERFTKFWSKCAEDSCIVQNRAIEDEFPEENKETGITSSFPPNDGYTLQKKLLPWKYFSVVDEELEQFSEPLQQRKKMASVEGLIVVASLIDKIPNLGGLCRSCEIFGVSKYVIPSLKLLNDHNFTSLSVSSERWVEIMEVFPRDLAGFLASYSSKGYAVLGVEQAVGSVPLNQYCFPKKSVLLLGNEKFGIPAELLHLVDQCLEIPQVGVVRSLNVHVTGALCIWQYATQHLIP